MTKIHTNICPICGGCDLKLNFQAKDHFASNELFSIYQCVDCGFGFTQDFPDEVDIAPYYDAPSYISHSDTQAGIINKLYHYARTRALKSKTNLVKSSSKKEQGTLLDLGAGTGYFLDSMRRVNWEVTGIEKSPSARQYCQQKFGLTCYDDNHLSELRPKSFDTITMWHVLEHIERLNDTLSCLHSILKDDGQLIIALPNKDSYDAVAYRQDWAAYDVPRHLWHFSPSDFELLASKHQFKIVKMKPMYFDAPYISIMSEKNKNSSCANLRGLFKGGLLSLQSMFNVKKCSSITYILEKNNL